MSRLKCYPLRAFPRSGALPRIYLKSLHRGSAGALPWERRCPPPCSLAKEEGCRSPSRCLLPRRSLAEVLPHITLLPLVYRSLVEDRRPHHCHPSTGAWRVITTGDRRRCLKARCCLGAFRLLHQPLQRDNVAVDLLFYCTSPLPATGPSPFCYCSKRLSSCCREDKLHLHAAATDLRRHLRHVPTAE